MCVAQIDLFIPRNGLIDLSFFEMLEIEQRNKTCHTENWLRFRWSPMGQS